MNKATIRRIAALERAYEVQDDAVLKGVTQWQQLQTDQPLTLDACTALAAPQQAQLQQDNNTRAQHSGGGYRPWKK